MSNRYESVKRKNSEQFNKFPMFFAFSEKDLEEGKETLGVTDNKDLLRISSSGFIRKKDHEAFNKMMSDLDANITAHYDNSDFLYDMFYYELANHEYGYTLDLTDTLGALGLTLEEISNNPKMNEALTKAKETVKNNSL